LEKNSMRWVSRSIMGSSCQVVGRNQSGFKPSME